MAEIVDIAVIGGGASGMLAAISAGRNCTGKIVVLERQRRVGRKLLATGNGRCNFSNINTAPGYYHGGDKGFIQAVIGSLDVENTLNYFQNLGLLFKIEGDGRIYPRSGQANSVLDILRLEMDRLGITVICDFEADKLRFSQGRWCIQGSGQKIIAEKVVLAAGGKASPALGGTGKGLDLALQAGHSLTPVFPAVSPVRIISPSTKGMKGIRASVEVSVLADGRCVKREKGELQFTDTGLSGICVFNLSRLAGEYFIHGTAEGEKCRDLLFYVDFMPEYSKKQVLDLLTAKRQKYGDIPLSSLLTGIFPKRLGEFLLKQICDDTLEQPLCHFGDGFLADLAALIKNQPFQPGPLEAWPNAQVCAGGVACGEIDPCTMESTLSAGLYLAGEIVDVDAPCGGFNLQWAWSSGYVAGKNAALALNERLEYKSAQGK